MANVPHIGGPNGTEAGDDARRKGLLVLLDEYQSSDPQQRELREQYRQFVAEQPDALSRSCSPGHITASAIVISHDGIHALLGFHRKGQFWGQLGGHIEPEDTSVEAAAAREVREESGLAQFVTLPGIARLDLHPLDEAFSCGQFHWDVQFAFLADPQAPFAVSEESEDLQWFPINRMPAVDDATFQLVRAAVAMRPQSSA